MMDAKPLRILNQLPKFPSGTGSSWRGLTIDGLVDIPATLSLEDLAGMPDIRMSQDFYCLEGWVVPNLRWSGVPISALLEMAGFQQEARFAAFSSGDFTAILPVELALAPGTILALRLDGEPLDPEHGGPCRLISPDDTCFRSVKCVERISLLAHNRGESASDIALQRISGQD